MSDIDFNEVCEKLKERSKYKDYDHYFKPVNLYFRYLGLDKDLNPFCEKHNISCEELAKTLFESKNLENFKNGKAIFNLKEFIEKLKNKFDIVVKITEDKLSNDEEHEFYNRSIKKFIAKFKLITDKELEIIINKELSAAEKNYYELKILSLYILDLVRHTKDYITYYLDLNDDDFILTDDMASNIRIYNSFFKLSRFFIYFISYHSFYDCAYNIYFIIKEGIIKREDFFKLLSTLLLGGEFKNLIKDLIRFYIKGAYEISIKEVKYLFKNTENKQDDIFNFYIQSEINFLLKPYPEFDSFYLRELTRFNLTEFKYKISETESKISETESKISETESKISETESKISETESKISETKSDMQKIKEYLEKTQKFINKTSEKIDKTEEEIEDNKKSLKEINKSILSMMSIFLTLFTFTFTIINMSTRENPSLFTLVFVSYSMLSFLFLFWIIIQNILDKDKFSKENIFYHFISIVILGIILFTFLYIFTNTYTFNLIFSIIKG